MRDFYQTFIQLCKDRGVAASNVAKSIGINKSSVSYWKKGAIPKTETLKALAQYFNVSVDYLTGMDDSESVTVHEVNFSQEPKATSCYPEKMVSEEDIKFALFGESSVTDEQFEEVKQFAKFVKERNILSKNK